MFDSSFTMTGQGFGGCVDLGFSQSGALLTVIAPILCIISISSVHMESELPWSKVTACSWNQHVIKLEVLWFFISKKNKISVLLPKTNWSSFCSALVFCKVLFFPPDYEIIILASICQQHGVDSCRHVKPDLNYRKKATDCRLKQFTRFYNGLFYYFWATLWATREGWISLTCSERMKIQLDLI